MAVFRKGDRVVHPRHGAAVVEELVERETFGERKVYLKLCLPHGLTLMVPEESTSEVGLRGVVSKREIEKVLSLLGEEEVTVSLIWSQRYKANMAKLISGDIYQVTEVIRHLSQRVREKGLSVADNRMLAKAREILISEVVFATDATPEHAEAMLDEAIARVPADQR
jgi:CarD family transcriptional regulator